MKTILGKKIFVPLSFTILLIEIYFKKAKEELTRLNTELRLSLKDKTIEIEKTNQLLQAEIIERKTAEKQLKIINEQLRKLTAHQQLVREDERTRISREIHDVLGQQLTVLKMDLSWLQRKLDKEETFLLKTSTKELITKTKVMLDIVDETVQLVKKISTELRPGILDDLGLIAALEWQSYEFSKRLGIECLFISNLNDLNIEQEVSTGIFRIFQEAITNVARHSMASELKINIASADENLIIEIKDNGKGISEQEINNIRSLGLLSMKERANIIGGELSINGVLGKGTHVKLKIPLLQNCLQNTHD